MNDVTTLDSSSFIKNLSGSDICEINLFRFNEIEYYNS